MSDVLNYLLGATAAYNQKERTMFGQETTYYEDIKKGSEKWLPEGPWWDEPLMDLDENSEIKKRTWRGKSTYEYWALRMPDGHWNGYMTIFNKDHILYGVDYTKIEMKIIVHGGLTYGRMNDDGSWTYGFDTHHTCDFSPTNPMVKEYIHSEEETYELYSPQYRTHSYVLDECISLCKQIDEFEEKDIDHNAEELMDFDLE